MTGAALRLMERSRPGVLHADLLACRDYADGLVAAAAVRCTVLAHPRCARPDGAAEGARRPCWPRWRTCAPITLPGTGHAMMAEEPDAVLDALRDFL